jgi:hypothetical protein
MTHILLSHFLDGRLAMAKPIIARTDDELYDKLNKFSETSVDEVIGDQVSVLTEEELVLIQNLDVDETYDSGE